MKTSVHTITWANDIAHDIEGAAQQVIITALSCLPPRKPKLDNFGRYWSRRVPVVFVLPAPTVAHPATLRNANASAYLESIGALCFLTGSTNLLHAKTVTIDDRIAWIGSGNITAAAAHFNRECWMRTDDARAIIDTRNFQQFAGNLARNLERRKP